MHISDLVVEGGISLSGRAQSRKQALQELARMSHELLNLDERAVFDCLSNREKLGSTALGGGVALPHGRFDDLDHCRLIVLRTARKVDFESDDDAPVDLIFCLLAPREPDSEAPRCLARIARMVKDQDLCDRLRGADSEDAAMAILIGQDMARAA